MRRTTPVKSAKKRRRFCQRSYIHLFSSSAHPKVNHNWPYLTCRPPHCGSRHENFVSINRHHGGRGVSPCADAKIPRPRVTSSSSSLSLLPTPTSNWNSTSSRPQNISVGSLIIGYVATSKYGERSAPAHDLNLELSTLSKALQQ